MSYSMTPPAPVATLEKKPTAGKSKGTSKAKRVNGAPTDAAQAGATEHDEGIQHGALFLLESSSHEPPDALFEELRRVCESAVDPLEVASALEFEGLNDTMAQTRYGYADVFELADELYRRVPRRPVEAPPPPDPWQFGKLRPVLHGLLYGLPALCFLAAPKLLVGPGVIPMLVVALLVAWSLSQALAYLGYVRLGRSSAGEERVLLRMGLAVCLALVLIVLAVCGIIVHAHLGVFWFGAGEGAYMLGACVLMVLGVGRWLLLALLPGVGVSSVFLALGRPDGGEHLVWGSLAATAVLGLVLALAFTRRSGAPIDQVCTASDLKGALPAAGFGLVAAGLLAFPVVAGVHGHGGINIGALLASLPISLSMGGAEASLLWYRRRTRRLLRSTTELPNFATGARLALAKAVLQYVAVAVALVIVAIVVATSTGLVSHLNSLELEQVATYVVLGVAMFLALTVQALGLRAVMLVACTAALAFEIAFHGLGITAQVVAVGALLIVVGGYALSQLANAVRHG